MDENAIHQLIHEIDGYKVMLDFDQAELYNWKSTKLEVTNCDLKFFRIKYFYIQD